MELLPHEICVEILQEVCRILELEDVSLAVPALTRMCKVLFRALQCAVMDMRMFLQSN
jgi:hypothetical protein